MRVGRRMLVGCAVLLAADPAASRAQMPAVPPAVPLAAADQAVLVYPASFFAGAGPNTALDMIQRLPGFTLDEGDLESRGLAGAAGNVLIDGTRPSSKSDSLGPVLARIAAASVERIELIRGGAPGIDMRGRAVVANIVLKRATTTERVAEANAFVYQDGAVGPSGKLSYTRRAGERVTEASIFATNDRTEGTTRGRRLRTAPDGTPLQRAALDLRDRYRNYDARGSVQRPLWGGKLQANGVLDYLDFRQTQATTIQSGTGDDERTADRTAYPNGEVGFTWTRPRGPRTTLELTGLQRLNRTTYRGTFDSAGIGSVFASRATAGESVVRATATLRRDKVWTFESGGEIAYNFLDSLSRYAQDGVAIDLPNAGVLVSELRGEGFAQATWHPSDALTLDGTLRGEVSRIAQSGDVRRSRGFVYPKGKLLATWLPGEGHQLQLRIEQEVGQLDFGDFAASSDIALGTVEGGNADLRPSRSSVIEAVYERRFWKKGAFSLTARHSAIADVVDLIPLAGGFDATGNIGSGVSDVIRANLTLPFDRLGVKGALLKLEGAARRSRVTDPLTGERRRFSGQQALECDISFSHDLKGGRFSYGFEHACNVDRTPAYRTAELRSERRPPFAYVYGRWKPSADLTLQLDLGNLVDGSRQTLRDVYAGPRDVAPLLYREDRATRRGRYTYVQVRKVF